MNLHYIEYMIQQRRLEEIEDCERRRMLHAAGYGGSGSIGKAERSLSGLVRQIRGYLLICG